MKNLPCKDGFIYTSMRRHRIKHLCRLVVVAIVFIMYFLTFKPYILNVVCGSVPLDAARFEAEVPSFSISSDASAYSDGSFIIRTYSVKSLSYWQDDDYEFDTLLSDVKETGISYTTKNTSDDYNEADGEGVTSAVLYAAKVNGVNTLVLSYPHQEIKDGITTTGIFTEFPSVIKTNIALLGAYQGDEFCEYMLDTRGIEMGSERFDITVCVILLLIIFYMLVKLCLYFINPLFTSTYRGLDKYGDLKTVIEDIEAQLKEKGISKISKRKPAVTDDWIVSEDVFGLKISKNHAKPQNSSRYGSKF